MTIVDDDEDSKPAAMGGNVETDVAAAACGSTITPDCLKSLYNIKYTAKPEGNLVAFASYLEEYARYSDLQTFETQYAPAAKGQNFSVTLVNGGLNDQQSSDDSGKPLLTLCSRILKLTVAR
jgi:tripeptidyl-peptidase-1